MDHYKVIEKALFYIENNLDQPLSLDSVSSSFHMSKFYFHRLFSAMMGCSLNEYITARRLNASAERIQTTERSLTEIAYELNFGTSASFSRTFKKQYGFSPNALRRGEKTIAAVSIPPVIKRPIKHINGDIVSDFTLTEFTSIRLSGIAFEMDLSKPDFKDIIRSHAAMLSASVNKNVNSACYVIYSNCQPNSTKFKALVGVPHEIRIDQPTFFKVEVEPFFCATFQYWGDLLDIGGVFITDFARFLKISRQEPGQSAIELIQVFKDVHDLESSYHIAVPIKKLPSDVSR